METATFEARGLSSYALHSRTETEEPKKPKGRKGRKAAKEAEVAQNPKEIIDTVKFIGGIPSFPPTSEPWIVKHMGYLIELAFQLPEDKIELTGPGHVPLRPPRLYSGKLSRVRFTFERDGKSYEGELQEIDVTHETLIRKKQKDIKGEIKDMTSGGNVIYPLQK